MIIRILISRHDWAVPVLIRFICFPFVIREGSVSVARFVKASRAMKYFRNLVKSHVVGQEPRGITSLRQRLSQYGFDW